jgi:hypothetical protein
MITSEMFLKECHLRNSQVQGRKFFLHFFGHLSWKAIFFYFHSVVSIEHMLIPFAGLNVFMQ